ncbi:hypothetical protein GOEFS_015_00390 [Gordonia effusa NBRC 100432]|uniref:DUF2470 domain-containing protein n=1 Tax=Gordonia effusa NBRC 100432 TaxID=1077974 RepID=H0QVG5_9ACTN|nr:DUF2470 domain-containing protein [Gordonia effusa]GAB16842.1 hypothetical protein GOEFS_015_00390 [Gordonia effusa NBRC 100432]
MTHVAHSQPSDAEAIQTACRRVSSATLAVGASDPITVNVVHLFESQAFVLVPTDCEAVVIADDDPNGIAALLEITDHAPIDLREQVRALVWLSGTLYPVPDELQRDLAIEIATDHPDDGLLDIGHGYSLLRLQVDSAVIANSSGAASVSADILACADPDPFWEYETGWITHLDSDHGDLVGQLARKLPAELRTGRVRPLGLDRFGLRFRIEGPEGDSDVRMPFPQPVETVWELSTALRSLAGCPFINSFTQ